MRFCCIDLQLLTEEIKFYLYPLVNIVPIVQLQSDFKVCISMFGITPLYNEICLNNFSLHHE